MRFPLSVPACLRVLLLASLVAAFFLPRGAHDRPGSRAVVRLDSADAIGLDDLLLVDRPPGLVVRASTAPPGPDELAAMTAIADRAPLLVALPSDPPLLRLSPPVNARVGRPASISFTVRGPPGDTVAVRLLTPTGPVDSLAVAIGTGGVATGAFRVRPATPGWHVWRVEAPQRVGTTGAWVRDVDPPHVLVVSGPPTWESRFVARSLDETGALVTVAQPLGRGLWVGTARLGASAEALAAYDAVLLLGGANADSAQLHALVRYVGELGGGVLAAGDGTAGAALGLTTHAGRPIEVDGAAIAWSVPAELTPLPDAGVRVAARTWAPLEPGVVPAATITASRPDETREPGAPHLAQPSTEVRAAVADRTKMLLALRPLGRGRTAALGLRETWRWRMEGGHVAAHREFWRSLVDWLAGGARDSILVTLRNRIGQVGVPAEVVVHRLASGAAPPARVALTRPDGSREWLVLAPAVGETDLLHATFVPNTPGVYTVAVGDGPARTAFQADATPAPAAGAWARLSLLAHRSGGAAVPADSLAAWLASWQAERRAWGRSGPRLETLLFILIALLAATEWTLRRLRGRT